MLQAFSGSFSILLMCLVGYVLYRKGFIGDGNIDMITWLVARVAVPCMLFKNAVTHFTRDFFVSVGAWFLLPMATIIALYALGYGFARLIRVNRSDMGVFCATFSLPNTIAIGLPITTAIFGEEGIPLMMSFYIATTLFFWSFGVTKIAKDGGKARSGWRPFLKSFFSPSILSLMAGTAVGLSPLELPTFLEITTDHLGGMTTPLSLLISGSILAKMGKEAFVLNKEGIGALSGRFIFAPVLCLGICLALRAPAEVSSIFVVQSALPSMNQVMLMGKYYGANERLGAQMLMVTTALSVVVTPLVVLLLRLVGLM